MISIYTLNVNFVIFYVQYSNSKISCYLWGKYVEIVYEGCTQNEDGMTICLIRFVKIGRFRSLINTL